MKVLDIESEKIYDVVKNSRDIEGYAFQEGTINIVDNGKLISKKIKGKNLQKVNAVSSIKQGQLNMTQNNLTKQISPFGTENNYLWTSVSPDGTKLLYYVIELGEAFVSNLDGSKPVSLGVLRAAKWMGNDWVVGMEDYDNGETLTASSVVMVSSKGKHRTVLTNKSVIATDPSGTPDARTIVYNTENGKVFVMKLEISE